MSYQLTTVGGYRFATVRSLESMQAAILKQLGQYVLFVKEIGQAGWVLEITKDADFVLTHHGKVMDRDRDFIPGWVFPLTQAVTLATQPQGAIT